jgi:hypothetical protein
MDKKENRIALNFFSIGVVLFLTVIPLLLSCGGSGGGSGNGSSGQTNNTVKDALAKTSVSNSVAVERLQSSESDVTPMQEQASNSQKFLNALSQELNVPVESLEVIKQGELSLSHWGRKFPTAKVRNLETNTFYEVTIDNETGKKVKKSDLIDRELSIKKGKYGKLEPELHGKLQKAEPDETVDVVIWLVAPDDPLPRPTPDEIKAKGLSLIESEMEIKKEEKKGRLKALQAPLLKELNAMNAEILHANEMAPLVTARLNSKQIAALADKSYVSGIYMSRTSLPALNVSVPTVLAPTVWSRGNTGQSIKVAIIEEGRIEFATNSYLHGTNRLNMCLSSGGYPYHATWVAGVVNSLSPVFKGIAPDSFLYGGEACGMDDSSLQYATTWAHDNSAHVHNNSWFQCSPSVPNNFLTSMSRFHDHIIRDWYMTVVDAAGNYGDPQCYPDYYVKAPANAYNVIAVGAFDDRNTITWSDPDVMWPNSDYLNPSSGHNDRQKPEIVAPGVNIITTDVNTDYFREVSGTSFAAPHVTGAAALLINRAPALVAWPEAVKAILMASATHNLEGASRLSEYDGAGGLNVDLADSIASSGNSYVVGKVQSGAPRSFNNYFYATAGQKVRAVIVWDADPNYPSYDIQPGMDLDLNVYTPSGQWYGFSSSWDNTFEIVEFTAPETGQYRLETVKYRTDDAYTWFAAAWNAYW